MKIVRNMAFACALAVVITLGTPKPAQASLLAVGLVIGTVAVGVAVGAFAHKMMKSYEEAVNHEELAE